MKRAPKDPPIPVLDLARRQGDRAGLARDFHNAYRDMGFAYVINHGVPEAQIDAVFDASRRFHALPLAAKMQLRLNPAHRGYIPINSSTDVNSQLAEVTKPNQSASFMMMREDAEADPDIYLSGPNQWPDLPGFRPALEAYASAMSRLGRDLMALVLEGLGQAEHPILAAFECPTIWLRLLHYPPVPPASPDDLYGAAPHTDFGCLTLLAQDDVGGLQVMDPDGNWRDAPRLPGAFVVNVGDMLHRISGGRLRSTPHRVINRSGRERFSCPFFFDPHVSTLVEPLEGQKSADFEPILFSDFLKAELEAGYDAHKPAKG